MKTFIAITAVLLTLVTGSLALDSPRELLRKLFGSGEPSQQEATRVEHCGRLNPHARHHWDDEHGHHRECPGVGSRGLPVERCASGRAHAAHVWEDEHGYRFHCPGVRTSYPSASCPSHKHHHAHVWEDAHGHRFVCPGHK